VGVLSGALFMFFGFRGRKNTVSFKLTGQKKWMLQAGLSYAVSAHFMAFSVISFIFAAETCWLIILVLFPDLKIPL
jgi:hypothetical protein